MSERLTKAQERILVAVFRRPMDVFDLADTVHLNVENTDKLVVALCKTGLAHRMYAEDEVSSTPTGRALLSPLKDNANG